jgi:general secretion pathway protein G
MKTQTHRPHPAGFTLVELVVVVAIIMVLAGLTLVLLTSVQENQKVKTTKLQIALMENALAVYHSDNGNYPSNTDPEGRKGDAVLFNRLYREGYEAKQNGANSPKIYLTAFDPERNTKGGQAWVEGGGAEVRIVDAWGESYRYRSGDSPNALNPDFDLWSCGPDKKTNADSKHADCLNDITSWSN